MLLVVEEGTAMKREGDACGSTPTFNQIDNVAYVPPLDDDLSHLDKLVTEEDLSGILRRHAGQKPAHHCGGGHLINLGASGVVGECVGMLHRSA